MKWKLFVGLLLCMNMLGYAQQHEYDSSYIEKYDNKLFVAPYLSLRNFQVFFKPQETNKDLIRFYPNVSNVFGAQATYKSISLGLGVKLPLAEFNARNYGKTKYLDLNVQVLKPKFILEGSFKNYKGMADLNSDQYYLPKQYYVRSDLQATYFKLNYIYIFSHKKFSYRSSYLFREKQKKSAGSWLATANLSYFKMKADTAFLPNELRTDFQDVASIESFRVSGLGAGGGYSHTFVLNDFFVSLAGFTGLEFKGMSYKQTAVDGGTKNPQITPLFDLRFSMGYNKPKWTTGISARSDFNFFKMEKIDGRSVYSNFTLYFGWRINPPKIVEKIENMNPLKKKG